MNSCWEIWLLITLAWMMRIVLTAIIDAFIDSLNEGFNAWAVFGGRRTMGVVYVGVRRNVVLVTVVAPKLSGV